jgi:hypothetical protein
MSKLNSSIVAGVFTCLFLFAAGTAFPQSGGSYTVEKTVVAPAGGSSVGGAFSVVTTVAQPIAAEASLSGVYNLRTGFQTSSGISISGRVLSSAGRGITHAGVFIIPQAGPPRMVQTTRHGVYVFDDLVAGQEYVIQIAQRRFTFLNNPRTITVNDSIANLDFIALP